MDMNFIKHLNIVKLTMLPGRENVQGLGANQIGACIMDGPKSIQNMSEISEVSEVSELGPKFEYCFYRNIANF